MTGSVATIRAPLLAHELLALGEVQAIATERARHFLDPLPPEVRLRSDAEEWESWKKLGDPVLHIELRKWADVLVLAPLSAHSLAKLANGLCDNLLLSVARAWDFDKPFIIAPAMNTKMWQHPITAEQVTRLENWGIQTIEPVVKELACADVGIGAMASPIEIAARVRNLTVPRV